MARTASGANPDISNMRQQRDQIREQTQTMDQAMERLRQGLTEEQREQLQSRLKLLEREREQLRIHQQSLDGELDSTTPSAKRLANRTRQVEQAMSRWQKQYQEFGKDLGTTETN